MSKVVERLPIPIGKTHKEYFIERLNALQSQSDLARELGFTRQAMQNWMKRFNIRRKRAGGYLYYDGDAEVQEREQSAS